MICEPLELEYIAAGLDGHEVETLDLIIERNFETRLRRFNPDAVAISCYITGVNETVKLCRKTKLWKRDCLTVVGGVHASVAPEDFADPAVDCIALTGSTELLPQLLRAWDTGDDLHEIPGVAVPVGPERVFRSPGIAYMDSPDNLPLPRRDLTARLRHRYYYLFHQPVATVKTTWGCWYDCSFCMTWCVTNGVAYSRSPESIVSELETIREPEIYIVDDVFLINAPRLQEIARLIRERGIRKNYLVYGRADFIAENEEVIREWSGIGLTAVIVGLEATTPDELRSLGKRTSVVQNREAIEVLRRNGIDIYASLIPQPWYTSADWKHLADFIEETNIYYVNISPFTPLPGSPAFAEWEDQLTVPRQAHPLWDLTHVVLPTRLSLKQYYRQLLGLYARTVLSIRRAARLTLRTRPPVWSRKYLRLWLGAVRIFFQFINAHKHHTGARLRKAMDRGPHVPGLNYRALTQESVRPSASRQLSIPGLGDRPRRPFDPYDGYLVEHPFRDTGDELVDLPSARRWRDVVSWGIREKLYTYQQPFEAKSGPMHMLEGQAFRMVSSYDYLGLRGHPEIDEAAKQAIDRYGTGTGGVRLLTGTTDLHYELDHSIARFKGVEASLSFSSGYLANLATISALFRGSDRVLLDSRAHRSIADGCKLTGVQVKTFCHNDPEHLEDLLRKPGRSRRTLVVIEGVYSMDGDLPPLKEIVSLKSKYDFYLMVDEAHSIGALGSTGRGVNEHFSIPADAVDIWMGSLSKAIPSCGGYIAGSKELIIYLHHGSSPFMFSAAASPAPANNRPRTGKAGSPPRECRFSPRTIGRTGIRYRRVPVTHHSRYSGV
jgi:7-keto-8-aminopelargonate synthetase-like enzyme/radical SAM superfamily enzyme YgiQ (UPF0313 family)